MEVLVPDLLGQWLARLGRNSLPCLVLLLILLILRVLLIPLFLIPFLAISLLEPSRTVTYVEYPYLEYSHGDRALRPLIYDCSHKT